jgi:alpha-D-ribose 1-methylphosphonate 5-triphosphate synthase subunit PhnL
LLEVRSLTKAFQINQAIVSRVTPFSNLSFSLKHGEFLGISGPSGIGKSSVLKCVYRSYLPTEGNILYTSSDYGVIDLASATERQIIHLRRHEISYVSQFLRVIPRVAAMDLIVERLLANGVAREEAVERTIALLTKLKIPQSLWKAYPATFSGGEQQRINLARAFIVRPKLLILDEPTASLDGKTKETVISLLKEMKQEGTMMIGVFHDTEVMEKIADRILDLHSAT